MRLCACLVAVNIAVLGMTPATADAVAAQRTVAPQARWTSGDPLVLKVAVQPGTVHYLDVHGLNLGKVDRVLVADKPATELHRLSAEEITFRAPNDTNGRVWLDVYRGDTGAPQVTIEHHAYLSVPEVTGVTPTTLSHGDRMQIEGAHLAGATALYVGGTRVPLGLHGNLYSQTFILRTVPRHAPGVWHVRVVTPYAESPATAADKTYYSTPVTMQWHHGLRADPDRGQILALSCPTDTFCAATDPRDVMFGDGETWSAPVTEPSWQFVDAVACTDPSFCLVADRNNVWTYASGTWTGPVPVLGSSGDPVQDLSCVRRTFCMALAGDQSAVFDGSSWSAPAHLPGNAYRLSCGSAGFCIANAGHGVYVWRHRGWSTRNLGALFVDEVSCTSAQFCMALDDDGNAFRLSGGSWSGPTTVFPEHNPTSLACSDASSCVASSYEGMVSEWDGAAWSPEHRLGGINDYLQAASCSSTRCVVADQQGRAFVRSGGAWSAHRIMVPTADPAAVSCSGADFCVVVDTDGTARIRTGTTWSSPLVVDPGDGELARGVDCVDSSFCAVVGPDGTVEQWNGSSWSAPQRLWPPGDPDEVPYLVSVSCTSSSFCMAVSLDGEHWAQWDGESWSPHDSTVSDRGRVLSCASPTLCVTPGYRWTGSGWTADPTQPTGLMAVSCPSTDFCGGFSALGFAAFDGAGWQTHAAPYATEVSCVTSTWCESAYNGVPRSWNGSYWSDPAGLFGGGDSVVELSCWAPNSCLAVGTDRTYSGVPR